MVTNPLTRRETMRKALASGVGIAATSSLFAGTATASRGKQKDCPPGTSFLAKYEASGCDLVFSEGEDVVNFTDISCVEGEVEGFCWETVDGSDGDSAAETVTAHTVKFGPNTESGEPSFYPVDKRAGCVDLSDEKNAISHVTFCQGTYAQVDFFRGDLITDLCNERYGDRALEFFDWGSYEGVLPGQGQDASPFDIDTSNNTVSIDYNPADFDEQVGLVVYEVPDPDFESNSGNISFKDTRCRQVVFDYELDPLGDQDGTLTASLPVP